MIDPRVDVPVDQVDVQLMGTGELLTSEGRGVRGGVPYGEQLETEAREVNAMHRFRPGAASALRAATKRALGR